MRILGKLVVPERATQRLHLAHGEAHLDVARSSTIAGINLRDTGRRITFSHQAHSRTRCRARHRAETRTATLPLPLGLADVLRQDRRLERADERRLALEPLSIYFAGFRATVGKRISAAAAIMCASSMCTAMNK